MELPEPLLGLVRAQSAQAVPPGFNALADAARALHGESVSAVLLYGSSLRTGNVYDGLADLYLLVDDYRAAFGGHTLALLNRLLPPNVFYLEVPFQGQLLRAKYAVLTLAALRQGTERWFHSYLWGRFAQPAALIYTRDECVAGQVHAALGAAVMTFVARTLPRMAGSFTARDLWTRGLSLSYRAELRTERPEGSARLFDAAPGYFQAVTAAVLAASPQVLDVATGASAPCYRVRIPARVRRLNGVAWRARILLGKLLSVLRLLKGWLTFKGGVDYILWKIERHAGVRVEVGPGLRRFPPLAVLVVFWRLYRRDAFR